MSRSTTSSARLQAVAHEVGPRFRSTPPPLNSLGGTITGTISSLAVGQSATFTFLVIPNGNSKSLVDTASVTSSTPDLFTNNNSASVTTPVAPSASGSPMTAAPASLITSPVSGSEVPRRRPAAEDASPRRGAGQQHWSGGGRPQQTVHHRLRRPALSAGSRYSTPGSLSPRSATGSLFCAPPAGPLSVVSGSR